MEQTRRGFGINRHRFMQKWRDGIHSWHHSALTLLLTQNPCNGTIGNEPSQILPSHLGQKSPHWDKEWLLKEWRQCRDRGLTGLLTPTKWDYLGGGQERARPSCIVSRWGHSAKRGHLQTAFRGGSAFLPLPSTCEELLDLWSSETSSFLPVNLTYSWGF